MRTRVYVTHSVERKGGRVLPGKFKGMTDGFINLKYIRDLSSVGHAEEKWSTLSCAEHKWGKAARLSQRWLFMPLMYRVKSEWGGAPAACAKRHTRCLLCLDGTSAFMFLNSSVQHTWITCKHLKLYASFFVLFFLMFSRFFSTFPVHLHIL